MGFPAPLHQPGSRHADTNAVIVKQDETAATHRDPLIRSLDQLAAGRGDEVRRMSVRIFLGRANVEQIERALAFLHHEAIEHRPVNDGNTDALRPGLRLRERSGIALARPLQEAVGVAAFDAMAGEGPANGAVAKREYLVLESGVDQRLGADDAARPSGTIDDDGRIRRGRNFPGAKSEL